MFAFNMTMPVTLVAVADQIPDYPGFAFGLASLALAVGAFPVLAGAPVNLSGATAVVGVVWLSAALLAVALRRLSGARTTSPRLAETIPEVAE
jgi:hypothetical protein